MRRVVVVGLLLVLTGGVLPLGAVAEPRSGEKRAPRAEEYDGFVTEETYIVDRFGNMLKAFISFPANDGQKVSGRFPVILEIAYVNATQRQVQKENPVPLREDAADVTAFVPYGYVGVTVNWAGTGPSEGWDAFFSRTMQLSSYDVVEWVAGFRADGSPSPAADWSTGKVGMFGGSGTGVSQVFTAQHHPPHLVTIIPRVTTTDFYRDIFYRGGIRTNAEARVVDTLFLGTQVHCVEPPDDTEQVMVQAGCVRKKAENLQLAQPFLAVENHQHPTYDAYWFPFTADLASIDIPIWSQGSWDDNFFRGNISLYTDAASRDKLLSIGFSGHGPIGPDFPQVEEGLRWYDHWLKGIDTGIKTELRECPVRYYLMQASEWRCSRDWPLPGTRFTDLYLNGAPDDPLARGTLTADVPSGESGSDAYVYDGTQGRGNGQIGALRTGRANTAEAQTFQSYNNPTAPADQRSEAAASPTYLSAPLEEEMEVTGPISMTLYASSTAADLKTDIGTNWLVKLVSGPPSGGPRRKVVAAA